MSAERFETLLEAMSEVERSYTDYLKALKNYTAVVEGGAFEAFVRTENSVTDLQLSSEELATRLAESVRRKAERLVSVLGETAKLAAELHRECMATMQEAIAGGGVQESTQGAIVRGAPGVPQSSTVNQQPAVRVESSQPPAVTRIGVPFLSPAAGAQVLPLPADNVPGGKKTVEAERDAQQPAQPFRFRTHPV